MKYGCLELLRARHTGTQVCNKPCDLHLKHNKCHAKGIVIVGWFVALPRSRFMERNGPMRSRLGPYTNNVICSILAALSDNRAGG